MEPQSSQLRSQARREFDQASHSARLRHIWAALTGQDNSLVPYEDLKRTLGFVTQHYRGLQPVPLDKIVGSLDRSQDFDRIFQPTQTHSRGKWVSVDTARLAGVSLPAVSLYRIGEAYFVVDGHHRVSVARQQGQVFIDAEVIEVQSRVPVTADITVDDLDVLAAYRDFLDQTKLDTLRPEQNVRLTMPGDYAKLIDHIKMHKYFVETDESRQMDWEEAVAHWYDSVYLPVYKIIDVFKLLADFPGATKADLYMWIIDHAYYLSQELDQDLDTAQVARDYVNRFSRRPKRMLERIRDRLIDFLLDQELEPGPPPGTWREERTEGDEQHCLFRDILVTLTGADTGWLALDQAIEIARLEQSTLHGLHILTSDQDEARKRGQQVLDTFTHRCQELKIACTTQLVRGDVAAAIIERARWVDLVVINQRRVHGRWSERPLGSIFQTVASQTGRPVLAVPGTKVVRPQRALLAYDGSPKAREALFVFRHLIRCWQVEGIILAVESAMADLEMQEGACAYAGDNGSCVKLRSDQGDAQTEIIRVMGEEGADLLLMGSYGHRPLLKAVLGSTVDSVLREAWFPVLICR